MNLTSCDNCGTVLDKDKLPWPTNIEDDDGNPNENTAWNGQLWVVFTPCPVCKTHILWE